MITATNASCSYLTILFGACQSPCFASEFGNPRSVQLHKEEERGQGLVGVLLVGKREVGVFNLGFGCVWAALIGKPASTISFWATVHPSCLPFLSCSLCLSVSLSLSLNVTQRCHAAWHTLTPLIFIFATIRFKWRVAAFGKKKKQHCSHQWMQQMKKI